MLDREDRAVMARINPEFSDRMKKRVLFDYPRFRGEARYDKDALRSELKKVKNDLAEAIYLGSSTEELLVRREVLYLLAEDLGML